MKLILSISCSDTHYLSWETMTLRIKVLKTTILPEHAVVLDRIKEETRRDGTLHKLSQTIRRVGKLPEGMLTWHHSIL